MRVSSSGKYLEFQNTVGQGGAEKDIGRGGGQATLDRVKTGRFVEDRTTIDNKRPNKEKYLAFGVARVTAELTLVFQHL